MKEVIIKYKKLIFIWTAICLLALFINIFRVECQVTSNVSLLSDGHGDRGKIWPFVDIMGYNTWYPYNKEEHYFYCNGIFDQFYIQSFILYMGILIAFLTYKGLIAKKPIEQV